MEHVSQRTKNLLIMLGILFIMLGICAIPSLVIAGIYNEESASFIFGGVALACFAAGLTIVRLFPPAGIRIKAREGFFLVALCWFIAAMISAIPLVATGSVSDFVDAFFEMCSGYSTTGASVIKHPESLPRSILFWRSFSQWIGGMGIIVVATAFVPSIGIEGYMIAIWEASGPKLDKLTAHFSDTTRRIYKSYIILTVALVVLLLLGGVSFYDALIHSFSTIGTGGFSSHSDSIAFFDSSYIFWIITLFMLLSGVNFNVLTLLMKNPQRAFRDEELRWYFWFFLGFTALVALNLLARGGYTHTFDGLTDAAFHVASVLSTTGFTITDYNLWPTFAKMILFLIMMIGACHSSSGGGVKIIRILVSIKLIRRGVSLKIHPNQVTTLKLNDTQISQELATNISNFMFLYMATVFIGSGLVALNGFDLMTTLSAVISCLSNVGPGFNLVGSALNYGEFSDFSKIVLSVIMIAGRVEMFTVFMLLSPYYWNPDKA